MSHALTACILE